MAGRRGRPRAQLRLSAPELSFIISDATPEVVFYDANLAPVVTELNTMTGARTWIETEGLGGPRTMKQLSERFSRG
ncbi:hypothetical protein [Defluviimonas salinarum]|uniref:hypothetical protein n=1 Tax=Defluviimonas salinarum TaxID=2992147 RepID=UPI00222E965D|nr:hypothetical protein [Defluviimonas salinarum]